MKVSLALVLSLGLAQTVALPQLASAMEAWNAENDPTGIDANLNRKFAELPLSGTLDSEHIPWSDTYWPINQGNIAARWHAATHGKDPQNFKYTPPTREAAAQMSVEDLKDLSPAEKYDLYLGHYDYPTLHAVWAQTSPNAPDWTGICNGWSAAAIHHKEPQPVTLTNPDGIAVPFGSSDIKGLLAYYYAFSGSAESRIIGGRCEGNYKLPKHRNWIANLVNPVPQACRDTNAGAFHLILANRIGIQHQAFVVDVDRTAEVWNQPVYAFQSEIRGEGKRGRHSAPGTVKRVRVATTMSYSREISPSWNPVLGTDDFASASRDYEYWLELDADGAVIGGEWISEERPDFLWTQDKETFDGEFAGLNAILAAARAN